jgi:hypothetical protein
MDINSPNSNRNTKRRLVKQLWTRWEHGSDPVRVYETGDSGRLYEYDGEFYESARQLLKKIHGRSYHHTFEQYFRIDDPKGHEGQDKQTRERPSVFALWGRKGESRPSKLESKPRTRAPKTRNSDSKVKSGGEKLDSKEEEGLVQGLVESFEQNFAEISGAEQARKQQAERLEAGLGIDLVNRGHEVRKLLFAGFRGMMAAKGYDPEDVLQEIYKGLLTRNAGKCPWDGKKSTFGYYVTMVCRCVLTNYHRKMSRRLDREHVELDEGLFGGGDMAGGSAELAHDALVGWLRDPEHGGDTVEGRLAVDVMPLLAAGCTRKEIVGQLGVSESAVTKATAHLRKWSREWAEEIGVQLRKK